MINRIHKLARSRNLWMVAIFVCYLALVLVFSGIYYFIHKKNGRAFAFNSDIARAQSVALEQDFREQLSRLASQRSLLNELKKALARGSEPTLGHGLGHKASTITSQSTKFTVAKPDTIWAGHPTPTRIDPPTRLLVSPLQGGSAVTIIGDPDYDLPENAAAFKALVDRWIFDWETKQTATRASLESLATDSLDIWSYWDFLYFSAITQFTVGYGDILPNTTSVRMVVTMQTCISAVLLVVVINLAFRRDTTDGVRESGQSR